MRRDPVPLFIGLMAGTLMLVVLLALVASCRSEHITLRSDEWTCTHSELLPYVYFIQVGKVSVPNTGYSSQCARWERKP